MKHDDEANFARRMAELRSQRNMSQSELARRMAERGFENYSQMTVSRTEKGERPIRLGEARVIAEILDSRLDDMTRGTDREEYIALLTAVKDGLVRGMLGTARELSAYREALDVTYDGRRPHLEDDDEVRATLADMTSYVYPPSVVAAWAAEVIADPMRDVPEALTWIDLKRMDELKDER